MRARVVNNEVLFSDERIVAVNADDMASLTSQALANDRRRMRLCTHENTEDPLHEMLIVHTRETYVRPHKHLRRKKSYHVIEGKADVIFFDDEGGVVDVIALGDYRSQLPFYCRISHPCYHSLLIRTPVFVFHETITGPFHREENLLAPWSPLDSDARGVEEFLEQLTKTANTYMRKFA